MQTVPFRECLPSFVDFLEDSKGSCDKIVLNGHNSASFDAHILLRTIQEYSPELLHTIKELNIHFADSLILFRNLIKEKHAGLKKDDGSFVKVNQEALYKHLFRTNFQGHYAFQDVKALSKILFKSSLQFSLSKIVNKSSITDINSAIGDMNYLDKSHALLKSFDEIIGDPSEGEVMKKSTTKTLANSGLGFHHLKRHCLRKCSRSKKWGSTDFLQTYPRGYTWSDITKYNLVLFSGILL